MLNTVTMFQTKSSCLKWIILFLILFIFYRGLELHLAKPITERVRFHAIPTAMSVLYHNHKHDYTGLNVVSMPFQGVGSTSDLIEKAKIQQPGENRSTYYWAADDRGFEDYVIAAFSLFGTHLISLYFLWFLILFTSVALFFVSFDRKIWALAYLGLVLIGVHLALSTLPYVHPFIKDKMFQTVVSIHEPRILDILAIIPLLHLLFLSIEKSFLKFKKHILPAVGQMFIFIFLYHARSSIGWEIVTIFAVCAFVLLFRIIGKKNFNAAGFVAVLLIVSLMGLQYYKRETYNPKYFAEWGTRTIWHNALMGLGEYDAYIGNKYQLSVDDKLIANSVIQYARSSNACAPDVGKLEAQELLNTFGSHGQANWVNYEACAKSLFFYIVKRNKLRVFWEFAVRKPFSSAFTLVNASRLTGNKEIDAVSTKFNIGWHPLTGINIILFVVILLLAFDELIKRRISLFLISLTLFLTSLIPSVLFYDSLLTVGGLLVVGTVGFYICLAIVLKILIRFLAVQFSSKNVVDNYQTPKKASIVIPAYNEEHRIAKTIREAYSAAKEKLDDFEIIVIDDGSKDETSKIANSVAAELGSKIRVFRQNINQGVGAAFHLGLKQANFPYLCLIPGDNAFNIEGIKQLFAKCGTSPLIISYRNNMSERTPLRLFLSRLLTHLLRVLTKTKIQDAHSLYLFPVKETRNLGVTTTSYGYHIEVLTRLLYELQTFTEVPVTLNPKPDASSGVMKPKTLLIFGGTLFKLFWLSFIGRLGEKGSGKEAESYG